MGNSKTPVQSQPDLEFPVNQNLHLPSSTEDATSASKKRCHLAISSPPYPIPQFTDAESKLDYVMDLTIKLMEKMDTVLDELRNVKSKLSDTKETVTRQSEMITQLQKQSMSDTLRISDLEYRNRALEDYTRAENIILHGVPTVKTDSEAVHYVVSAAKAVGINISDRDISACH